MRVDLRLNSEIVQSARVTQLSGMFDLPIKDKSEVKFHFEVPIEEKEWQIGLIVGPSGAGKSSVARHLFGDALTDTYDWKPRAALVDGFGDLSMKEITLALSSVGFSSPPSWVKPFSILSNGEKFRANMARVLVDKRQLIVVDEFTSVVDRQVAKIGSHTIQKSVRSVPGKKLVAVTCHYDVEDWLQPDWVLEPHSGKFDWRCLRRRPAVDVEITRAKREAWSWFAPHHYLSSELRPARCFLATINNAPVAFAGIANFPHPSVRDIQTLTRIVVMPDYQGLGLGTHHFASAMGRICAANGFRLRVGSSHPALILHWAKSPLWNMSGAPAFASVSATSTIPGLKKTLATKRKVGHFEWCGGGFQSEAETAAARELWSL